MLKRILECLRRERRGLRDRLLIALDTKRLVLVLEDTLQHALPRLFAAPGIGVGYDSRSLRLTRSEDFRLMCLFGCGLCRDEGRCARFAVRMTFARLDGARTAVRSRCVVVSRSGEWSRRANRSSSGEPSG